MIYLYQDDGVSAESLKQTVLSFQNLHKDCPITTINAEKVKEGLWTQNARLFVMPGGADSPYVQNLNGQGNEIIKQYVIRGGSFLGICAGSYYGASYVEFDKNGPWEVLGHRELAFFKGRAVGPVLAPYDKTQKGARSATIRTVFPDVMETTVFYNGGGFFENAEHDPNTTIIGTYANHLPAIIFLNFGRGKVLLSGVHFEYDPFLLNAEDVYIKQIIDSLYKGNPLRQVLFKHLINLLLTSRKPELLLHNQ